VSLVDATYIGPPGYALDTGVDLIPGETVVQIPEFQAEDDACWKPVNTVSRPSSSKADNDTSEGKNA